MSRSNFPSPARVSTILDKPSQLMLGTVGVFSLSSVVLEPDFWVMAVVPYGTHRLQLSFHKTESLKVRFTQDNIQPSCSNVSCVIRGQA